MTEQQVARSSAPLSPKMQEGQARGHARGWDSHTQSLENPGEKKTILGI